MFYYFIFFISAFWTDTVPRAPLTTGMFSFSWHYADDLQEVGPSTFLLQKFRKLSFHSDVTPDMKFCAVNQNFLWWRSINEPSIFLYNLLLFNLIDFFIYLRQPLINSWMNEFIFMHMGIKTYFLALILLSTICDNRTCIRVYTFH